jgi:hypothetical protein
MSRSFHRALPGIFSAALGLVLGAGCAGEVGGSGNPGTGTGSGSPGAAGSTGGPGTGTGAAGTGATGTAGATGAAGAAAPGGPLDVGITSAIRLNRTQYNNTVRDLLGTTLSPGDSFPADETSLGFDTIGGVLKIQPERSEKYVSASADLINELLARPTTDPNYKRFITCDYATAGATCMNTIIKAFATKAWRRPVMDAELTAYGTLAAAGPTPKDGLTAALRAVLVSSNFLYRFERDPNPDDVTTHRLNGYELASRLSYFLWGTMPDDALITAAAGGLTDDAGLKAQVARLLADQNRIGMMIDTWGAQWLGSGKMLSITPDKMQYPMFNDNVRAAMIQEEKRFLLDYLGNNKPIPSMLSADFTYLNATLAAYYGMPAVTGDTLTRVPTAGSQRTGGLLTLGSFLAGESNPTRTSPVKRGLFVLDRLLCSAPPPPPPTVNTNIDEGPDTGLPIRQRLANHQKLGSGCGACHSVMDSIGLSLENFDGVGRYRASDENGAIDNSGTLNTANGPTTFMGVTGLAGILAADTRFVPCVVQKMLTFSIGRDFSRDVDLKKALTTTAGGQAATLRGALEAVVLSDAFRSRRAAMQSEVMP